MSKIAVIFPGIDELKEGLEKIEKQGIKVLDIYSPVPIKNMGQSRLRNISVFTLIGGIVGCLVAFTLQYGITNIDYKMNFGGKPFFAVAYAVPVMFELTVLFAAISTFIGFLCVTRLPKWYSDIKGFDELHEMALKDKFVLVIETKNDIEAGEIKEILAGRYEMVVINK